MIEITLETGAAISKDRRYFIASDGVKTVADFSRAVSAHWGIKSMHWVLREEACRVRKITLAMLRPDTATPRAVSGNVATALTANPSNAKNSSAFDHVANLSARRRTNDDYV